MPDGRCGFGLVGVGGGSSVLERVLAAGGVSFLAAAAVRNLVLRAGASVGTLADVCWRCVAVLGPVRGLVMATLGTATGSTLGTGAGDTLGGGMGGNCGANILVAFERRVQVLCDWSCSTEVKVGITFLMVFACG